MRLGSDIDGTFVDLREAMNYYLSQYGVSIDFSTLRTYYIERVVNLPKSIVEECVDKSVQDLDRISAFPGAVHFFRKYFEETGRPIIFITSRDIKSRESTYKVIDKFLDVPYEIVFTASKGIAARDLELDLFIEDVAEVALDVATYVPLVLLFDRPYNSKVFCSNIRIVQTWQQVSEIFESVKEVSYASSNLLPS